MNNNDDELLLDWDKLQLNPKQEAFLQATQKTRTLLGGRASGKSFLIGVSILLKMIEMPGSKGGLASTNFNQLKTKTLSSVLKPWKILGMVEDVDYVIGKKPPKHFEQPINAPIKWDNIITVSWGSCVELLSLVRRDGVRGGTYDYLEVDEAALVKKADYTQALIPAVRDNKDLFFSDYHQQISFYTSIPWQPSGYWILDFEEKHRLEPKKYFWLESDAYDNIHIIGEDGIERLREEMDFLEFEIEVMNRRVNRAKNPYYPKFDFNKHVFRTRYKEIEYQGEMLTIPTCVDLVKEFNMSFDFGGNINSCTIWQTHGRLERKVSDAYKKGGNNLKDLVLLICERYKYHKTKRVKVWGEPRGHNKEPASKSMFELVQEYFEENGWKVEIMAPKGYKTDYHEVTNELVNEIFEGSRADLPQVEMSEFECKNSIIVLQTTEWHNGKKDKRNEKNASYAQELATHFSDCDDYYLKQKHGTRKAKNRGRKRNAQVI
jgi:hypothetical protein